MRSRHLFLGGAVQVVAVDEASTLATMLGGLALLTAALRRTRRTRS
jgi:MYXO-CTERM domain-containing protein